MVFIQSVLCEYSKFLIKYLLYIINYLDENLKKKKKILSPKRIFSIARV